ncbi:MAG: LacI family DNA-binding transcriptional regulator, partial [Bauldia sp.]
MTARAGKERVTIIEIAAAAGVSKSTVSLVLKGSDSVHPETRDRVNAAIRELGYVYNRGAANLRQARSNIVGMIINDLTNPFFAELAVGIERSFQSAGYVPFIANTAENPVRQEEVLKSMLEQGVAGLIVSPARGSRPDAFRRVEAAGIPVVFAMRRLPESRIPIVAPDNHRGAWLAARHLVERGHRRLAFFGGSADLVVYHERLEGFREACRQLGVPDRDVTVCEGETHRKGGMACLDTAMAGGAPPTAALCFNDAV